MCGHTKFDEIRNRVIRGNIGAQPLEDKKREARRRWFDHVRRRSMETPVRRYENIDRLDYKRSKSRPKKSWSELIRHNLKTLGRVEDVAQDGMLWMSRIKIVDF